MHTKKEYENNETDHNLLFYFHNNPKARALHRSQYKTSFKTHSDYLNTMKMLHNKYINSEIKLKEREKIKKFYYGLLDLETYRDVLNYSISNYNREIRDHKHTKPITNILFSKKVVGLFYTSSWDGKIFLYNTDIPLLPFNNHKRIYSSNILNFENQAIKLFKGHTKGVYKIHEPLNTKFSIFSVSFDNLIKQWDVNYNKILSRNPFSYNLIDSIENNSIIYLLTKNNTGTFISNLDNRVNIINEKPFKENYTKILHLKESIFLLLNKNKQIYLFDDRNQNVMKLDYQAINMFKGNNEIFFTQKNSIEIINNDNLCINKKFDLKTIKTNNLIENTAEIIKSHEDIIITKNNKGFTIYKNFIEKTFYENKEFITDFDFQTNKLIYSKMDGSIGIISD